MDGLVASVLVYGVCKAMGLKPSKESALLCFAGTIGATGCTVCLYYAQDTFAIHRRICARVYSGTIL